MIYRDYTVDPFGVDHTDVKFRPANWSLPDEEPKHEPRWMRRMGSALGPHLDVDKFAEREVIALALRIFLITERHCVVFCGVDETGGSEKLSLKIGIALASHVRGSVCVLRTSPYSKLATEPCHVDVKREDDDHPLNLCVARLKGAGNQTLEGARTRIENLREEFDYLLIDAAPTCLSREAIALGQSSDGVVLIVEANTTRRVSALQTSDLFASCGVRFLGVVLNNRTFPIPEKLYTRL